MKFSEFFLLFFLGVSLASAKDIPSLATEVKTRLENNPATAFAWIEAQGTPSEVCDIYDQAVRDLYWLDKGAKNLVVVGKRGISFCLEQANLYVNSNTELADKFLGQAKTVAYNVAANSWPGWGDQGVIISASETEAGLEAAKLNLRLAIELKKPADKVAGAYWLLSALQLALQNFSESHSSIDQSNLYAAEAGDKTILAYGEGFKGLIYLASGNQTEGTSIFESGIVSLRKIGGDDANFYIGQLETSRKIFVK